jgi:hypothetical protein
MGEGMKVKESAHLSVYLLRFVLCFGIFCILCSSCAAFGAFYPYGGAVQWWKILSDGLQHEGILYLNGTGFAFSILGSFLISVLSFLAFVFALGAYRRNKIGKKPMMWAMLLFGGAVLVLVGSIMISRSSLCTENPAGSDDTIYCTFSLHPAITLPSHTH